MYDITHPAMGVSMTVQNKFIKMPLVFRNYFFLKKKIKNNTSWRGGKKFVFHF